MEERLRELEEQKPAMKGEARSEATSESLLVV